MEIKFRCRLKSNLNLVMDHKESCRILYNSACGVCNNIDSYIIEQYANLKDKNGIEIYVGDVIFAFSSFTETFYELEIKYDKYGFSAYDINTELNESSIGILNLTLDFLPIKIIGNIHQNQTK